MLDLALCRLGVIPVKRSLRYFIDFISCLAAKVKPFTFDEESNICFSDPIVDEGEG
jgi:hypothetical protein